MKKHSGKTSGSDVRKKPQKTKKTVEKDPLRRKQLRKAMWHAIRRALMALGGALVYAVGLGLFLEPNHLSAGGVAGIALLLSQVLPIGTGVLILVLNVPILLLGMWKFGMRFMGMTVAALVLSSPLIDLLAARGGFTQDPMLASLAGGALMGVGMGVLFRSGASSGGTDIISKLLHLRFPYIKTSVIFLTLDAIILVFTAAVFRDIDVALYAAVGILVSTYLMNIVLYGSDEARMLYIVTAFPDEVAALLLKQLGLGGTFLQGYGAYTGDNKRVLLCVMHPKQLPAARELVATYDHNAFMIVAGASSVYGEGFKPHDAEDF